MLTFSLCKNPFSTEVERLTRDHRPGHTVRSYVPHGGYDWAVDAAGRALDLDYVPEDGEEIELSVVPAGPLPLAVIVGIGLIGIGTGAAFGLKALQEAELKKEERRARRRAEREASATRDFDGIQNTVGADQVLPLVYGGPVKIGGHIISSFEQEIQHIKPEIQDALVKQDPDAIDTVIKQNRLPTNSFSTLWTRLSLCAGPIEEITDVRVDDNPADDIDGLTYSTRVGNEDQPALHEFDKQTLTRIIQLPFTNAGGPATFETQLDVDTLTFQLNFPNGIIDTIKANTGSGSLKVDFQVEYRNADDPGASFIDYKTFQLQYLTRAPVNINVQLPELDRGRYEVRVTRLSADDTGGEISNVQVQTLTEIIFGFRTFPGVANMGFKQIALAQLSTLLPNTYTAVVKGFKDIRMYTSTTKFTTGWTDNPAWCCAHYITNKTYGLGNRFTWDDIDILNFVEWATFCDELIDDGNGGFEKRCLISHVFDTEETAQDILLLFGLVGEARVIFDGSRWRAVIDRPREPVTGFNESEIDSFEYTFVPDERISRLITLFRNQDLDWSVDAPPFEDQSIIAGGNEFKNERVELFGMDRLSQAERVAKRLMNESILRNKTVRMVTNTEALDLKVGDLFHFTTTETNPLGAGRLLLVESDLRVRIDQDLTFEASTQYVLHIYHVTDDYAEQRNLKQFTAQTTTDVVDIEIGGWERLLVAGDRYAILLATEAREIFECTSVSLADDFKMTIEGLKYDSLVYNPTIVNPQDATFNELPNPLKFPPEVQDLILVPRETTSTDISAAKRWVVDADWNMPVDFNVDRYEVWIKRNTISGNFDNTGTWLFAGETRYTSFRIFGDFETGENVMVRVIAVSRGGAKLPLTGGVQDESYAITNVS